MENEKDEVVEKAAEEDQQLPPDVEAKDDRPEINYKRELERKNAELARLRAEQEKSHLEMPKKYDPNDITTWQDNELKQLVKSKDPNLERFQDQAQDLLLERRFQRAFESQQVKQRTKTAGSELQTKYPEALDPSSEFSTRMEAVMDELDLQKTPVGRLAAARIVAAELSGSKTKRTTVDRISEDSRIRDVKSQMVDGDRFKPTEPEVTPKKAKALEDKIRKEGALKADGLGEALKQRGISRDNFFKR